MKGKYDTKTKLATLALAFVLLVQITFTGFSVYADDDGGDLGGGVEISSGDFESQGDSGDDEGEDSTGGSDLSEDSQGENDGSAGEEENPGDTDDDEEEPEENDGSGGDEENSGDTDDGDDGEESEENNGSDGEEEENPGDTDDEDEDEDTDDEEDSDDEEKDKEIEEEKKTNFLDYLAAIFWGDDTQQYANLPKDIINVDALVAQSYQLDTGIETRVTAIVTLSELEGIEYPYDGVEIRINIPESLEYVRYSGEFADIIINDPQPLSGKNYVSFDISAVNEFSTGGSIELPFSVFFPSGITPDKTEAELSVEVFKDDLPVAPGVVKVPEEDCVLTANAKHGWVVATPAYTTKGSPNVEINKNGTPSTVGDVSIKFSGTNNYRSIKTGNWHTQEYIQYGTIEIPSGVEFDKATFTGDVPTGVQLVKGGVKTVPASDIKKVLSSYSGDNLEYTVYHVYSTNNTKGLVYKNDDIGNSDLQNKTFSVTLENVTFEASNKNTLLSDNTYSNGAVIYAGASGEYLLYQEDEHIPLNKETEKKGTYAIRAFRDEYEGAPRSEHLIPLSKSADPNAIKLNDVPEYIEFKIQLNSSDSNLTFLNRYMNPYIRTASSGMLYYPAESLNEYIIEDARHLNAKDPSIWDYAKVIGVTTGSYEIGYPENADFSQYSNLFYKIQYTTDENLSAGTDLTWHDLKTVPVFDNGKSAASELVDVPDNATGVRWVFSDENEGLALLPPGFRAVTMPSIRFELSADYELPADENSPADRLTGDGHLYNYVKRSYSRPSYKDDKFTPGEFGPAIVKEAKASVHYTDTNTYTVYRSKEAYNLTTGEGQKGNTNAAAKPGDEIRYSLIIGNDKNNNWSFPLRDLTITDRPDEKYKGQEFKFYDVKIVDAVGSGTTYNSKEIDQGKVNPQDVSFNYDENTHQIVVTFPGSDYKLEPGRSLVLSYTVEVPDSAVNQGGLGTLKNTFDFEVILHDNSHEVIRKDGDGECTITIKSDYPEIGIRKYTTDTNTNYMAGDTVSFAIEAKISDKNPIYGEDQYVLITDRFDRNFNFDEQGKAMLLSTMTVSHVPKGGSARKLNASEYQFIETKLDNTPTDGYRYFGVLLAADQYFKPGDLIRIEFKAQLGPERIGTQNVTGKTNYNTSGSATIANMVNLGIVDGKTGAHLSTDQLVAIGGNWGSANRSSVFVNAGLKAGVTGLVYYDNGLINSASIIANKTSDVLGLKKDWVGYETDDSTYYFQYKVILKNYSGSSQNFNASSYFADVLPYGQTLVQTGNKKPTMQYFSSDEITAPQTMTVTPKVMGKSVDDRDLVRFTSSRTLVAGSRIEMTYWTTGNVDSLTGVHSSEYMAQNWVAFNPNKTFAVNPGTGTVGNMNVNNPYGFTVSSTDNSRNSYIYAVCDVTQQFPQIKPGIVKNLLNTIENGKLTLKKPEEILANGLVRWRLKVENGAGSEVSMKDFKVVDVLPAGFTMIPNTSKVYKGTSFNYNDYEPFTGTVTTSVINGKQVITWEFNEEVPPGTVITLLYDTKPNNDAYGESINYAYLVPSQDQNFDAANVIDGIYKTPAQSSTEMGQDAASIMASDDVSVYGLFALQSEKSVKTQRSSASRGNYTNIAYGEEFTYTLTIKNNGEYQFRDLVVIDVLPHIGDTGVKLVEQSRNSAWTPVKFKDLTVTINNVAVKSGYTLQFKSGPVITAEDWKPNATEGWNDEYINGMQSVRFELTDKNLSPNDTIDLTFKMAAPDQISDTAQVGTIAWNSFAYELEPFQNAAGLGRLRAEPPKVGLKLDAGKIEISKEIIGYTEEDDSAVFHFIVEEYDNASKAVVEDGFREVVEIMGEGSKTIDVLPGFYRITETDQKGYELETFNGEKSKSVIVYVTAHNDNDNNVVKAKAVNKKVDESFYKGQLTIEKAIENYQADTDSESDFKFDIVAWDLSNNAPLSGTGSDYSVTISGEGRKTIEVEPGTYKITEASNKYFELVSANAENAQQVEGGLIVTINEYREIDTNVILARFVNKRVDPSWLKGHIEISKIVDGDEYDPEIHGDDIFKFNLYPYDRAAGQVIEGKEPYEMTLKMRDGGVSFRDDLEPGTYLITETTQKGYQFVGFNGSEDQEIIVDINEHGGSDLNIVSIKATNKKIDSKLLKGKVILTKELENDFSTPADEGKTFRFKFEEYDLNLGTAVHNGNKYSFDVAAGKDNALTIEGIIEPGYYKVTEEMSDDRFEFIRFNDGEAGKELLIEIPSWEEEETNVVSITAYNKKVDPEFFKGRLSIVKEFSGSEGNNEKFTFLIRPYDKEKDEVISGNTDYPSYTRSVKKAENWRTSIEDIKPGTYIITEIQDNTSYELVGFNGTSEQFAVVEIPEYRGNAENTVNVSAVNRSLRPQPSPSPGTVNPPGPGTGGGGGGGVGTINRPNVVLPPSTVAPSGFVDTAVPDTFVILDDEGVPRGYVTFDGTDPEDEESWVFLEDDPIPLGTAKQNPKTANMLSPVLMVNAALTPVSLSLILYLLYRRKQLIHA